MLEQWIRPTCQSFLFEAIANRASKFSFLSANRVTALSCVTGILSACLIGLGRPIMAIVVLLLSGYLDALDGSIARAQGTSSSLGTLLDLMSDRVVEFAIIMGLVSVDSAGRGWLGLWMLGSILICVTSFLVVGMFQENEGEKSFHYSPGIIERPEAFIFFIAMIAWPASFNLLAILFSGLVFLTAAIRVIQFY